MDKYFNECTIGASLLGGIVAEFCDLMDTYGKVLIALMALDYMSGLIKAIYKKRLSSQIGFKGILKKCSILLIVVMTKVVAKVISPDLHIEEMVSIFFISNEAISLLENTSVLVPIPIKLKNILLAWKGEAERENDISKPE